MRLRFYLPLLIVLALATTTVLQAQEPIELTVSPRAIEHPLMKYRLLPAEFEKKDGNAATIFLRLPFEQTQYMTEVVPTFNDYLEIPLDDPKLLDAGDVFNPRWYDELKRAAYRRDADWEYPIGEEKFFSIMLPDVQVSRSIMGRGLSVWIRHQLAHGHIDKAMEGIKVGLANSRHLSQTPIVIVQLVSTALNSMMCERIVELLNQPDCPNLYWAFTALPRPFLNRQPSYDMEQHLLFMDFPELQTPDDIKSDQAWNLLAHKVFHIMIETNQGKFLELSQTTQETSQIITKLAKIARKQLPQMTALPAQQIQSMSDAEAGLRFFVLKYEDLAHQLSAFANLEPVDAIPRMIDLNKQFNNFRTEVGLEDYDLFNAEYAYLGYIGIHRTDRKIAALRIVEALRHYAATHQGKLPATLTDIKDLSIPKDPFTDKPFGYAVKNGVATLSGLDVLKDTKYNRSFTYKIKIRETK